MIVEKVISGGQNGSDLGGLRAAKEVGIPTGGWLPSGCITLDGPKPEFISLYNMQEHSKKGYPPRTEANVRDSDGTIRFARNFKSPGEQCTLKAIKWHKKVHLDIDVRKPPEPETVRKWINENKIKILNIAGNSEETAPGIGDFVYSYLLKVFLEL